MVQKYGHSAEAIHRGRRIWILLGRMASSPRPEEKMLDRKIGVLNYPQKSPENPMDIAGQKRGAREKKH